MIENIREKREEVKEIWLKNKEGLKLGQFYKKFLGDYFNVEGNIKGTRDWLFFLNWYREWYREAKKEKGVQDAEEEVTEEDIEEIQGRNRKRIVLILKKLLDNYDKESDALKKTMSISEIIKTYRAIQSLEEKMKMTTIARGKLKLNAVRTLLPYKRMKPEELAILKEKLNESFDRIIKLKSGSPVGRSNPDRG